TAEPEARLRRHLALVQGPVPLPRVGRAIARRNGPPLADSAASRYMIYDSKLSMSPKPMPARPPAAAERPGSYATKQELVYCSLRDAIMRCELAPGQRLVIDDLARRLNVSAIPVREALHLLSSERLVVNVPHVGATVAPIVPESVHDVFTVMEGLETVAARVAADRLHADHEHELGDLLRVMDEAVRTE